MILNGQYKQNVEIEMVQRIFDDFDYALADPIVAALPLILVSPFFRGVGPSARA